MVIREMTISTIIISEEEKETLDITGRVIIARSSRYKDNLGCNQDMFGANVTYKKYFQHPSRVYLFGYCVIQLLEIVKEDKKKIYRYEIKKQLH
ncbi:MAG: hypothetical protein QG670_312 [Thermoproteota archaeon]|nr:hypothetical protein [Thermoproteota archaeon]